MTNFLVHRLFLTPIFSYIGAISLVWSLYTLAVSFNLVWAITLILGIVALLIGNTVGLHRLFCHQAFETNKIWHIVLAYFGTLCIYGSTVQWAGMHMTHHQFSDTDKDPHFTEWTYLFWKKHNPILMNKRAIIRLYKSQLHRFLHDYYVLVVGLTIGFLWWVGGFYTLVFCYLAPLGWLHFVESIHKVFSHGRAGPLDQGWLEIPLCTGGEWNHKYHHENPKDIRFGKLDLGYWFIKLIRR